MFGWVFRQPPTAERLAAGYERIRDLFGQRFPTGAFRTCDFRPHFDGHGHNACVEIAPRETVEATRAAAYAKLAEMVEFLRPLQSLFGPHDRAQFTVGFPVTVKPHARWIIKGWAPTARLADVRPPDFAAVGGAIGENDTWFDRVWA